MTDFTPGPWVNENGLVYGRDSNDGTASFDIYDAGHWPGDGAEAQANARLIAEAPKMYAALKALHDSMASAYDDTKPMVEARAVIAKVDGA